MHSPAPTARTSTCCPPASFTDYRICSRRPVERISRLELWTWRPWVVDVNGSADASCVLAVRLCGEWRAGCYGHGELVPVPERVGAAYRCGRHDEQAVHTPIDLSRPSAGSVTALAAGLVVSFRSGQVHFELVPGRAALRHIDHSDGPPNALAPI